MEKTAVNYLLEQMGLEQLTFPKDIIDKAREMEKKQIMNAYFDGGIDQPKTDEDCEQHYLETFKTK